MASGSDYTTLTSSAGNKARLEISWVENSTNINNNTSNITITGRIKMTSGAFASDYVPYLRVYWHNYATGSATLIGEAQVSSLSSSWYTISDTINVAHYEDGTGRGYAYAVWTGSSLPYTPQSGSIATESADLTTIARASKPTATNGYIGQPILINTNRASTNFTHTLSVSFGSFNTTIGTNIGESVGFILPNDFYAEIPNSSSGTGTITCTTYQGSTQIGSPQTTTFKAMCDPEVCKPTFDYDVVLTDGTATTSLTGSSDILIANYSEAEIQWTATAKNGATIKRVYFENFDNSYTTSPINLYFSESSSLFTNGFNLWCVDSREIATQLTKTYTIKQWFRPSVSLNARRTSPTGSEVRATFTGSFFNESFGQVNNTLSLTWKYRETGETNWTNGGTLTNGTHYNIVGNDVYSGTTQGTATEIVLSSSVFEYNKTYEVGLFAEDEIASSTIINKIPKGKPIYWWNENGLYWGQDDSKFITENDLPTLNTYSTNEQIVGYWIDDKPIYRKVITSSSMTIISDVADNVDNMIKMECMARQTSRLDWRSIPFLFVQNNNFGTASWGGSFFYNYNDNTIEFQVGSNLADVDRVIIILEYTKTTD